MRTHNLLALAALGCVAVGGCQLLLGLDNRDTPDAGGTGNSTPPGCDPTKLTIAVDDKCGTFVSSSVGSDTTGKGTKEAPYATLGTALTMASSKPVYACGETFTVQVGVALSTPVNLYGALDCTKGWVYDATKRTQLQADPAKAPVPLTLAAEATGSSVHDFVITAVEATSAGGSSIAIIDGGADLTLENVDVVAGSGSNGAPGTAQAQVMTPTSANGQNGTADAACNNTNVILGSAGGTNTCNGTSTNGGNGGKGIPDVSGGPGGFGLPKQGSGNGGSGQVSGASCNASDPKGLDAASAGTPGTGARGIGDIGGSGYTGPSGVPGGSGPPGQGGGGGGGAHACDVNNMFAGPSGGGGGAGGCGGASGNSGQSGGSSIGILVLGANLTLSKVKVTTQSGGTGGLGGNGQAGGNGGVSGMTGGSGACPGGTGGQGGVGGPGGGGAGGHSVGIAINGGALPDLSTTTITLSTSMAKGGTGGDADMTAQTAGDPGKTCKTLDFGHPASSTACAM